MPQEVAHALRHRLPITDPRFDRIYPIAHRPRSEMHWTPLEVALRACALLGVEPSSRVLDIGAGVGKLCLVGALTTSARWFGIERVPEMVAAANAAAAALGVADRARFLEGDAESLEWSMFDAFYLFNPFAEQLWAEHEDPLARRDAYLEDVALTQQRLAEAIPGTRVVTYHGFGGDMPPSYELLHREAAFEDELQLWVRRRTRRCVPVPDLTA
jgi:SAM-dependent methyltransferase